MNKNKLKIIIFSSSLIAMIVICYIVFKYFQRKSARKVLKDKVISQSSLSLATAFNISRWKTGTPKISDVTARSIAQKINSNIGWFSEDEDKISAAFYLVQNYDDLSLVAFQYQQLYDKDLNSAITAAFSGDTVKLARLRSIIASKVKMN